MAKRWYSVSVLSNFEKKIAEQIRTDVASAGLEDEIDEVLVPTEEVIEVRRGKKVTAERRFMPGYVLVHMEMSDRGYHLINSINRVTGFLGFRGENAAPARAPHSPPQPADPGEKINEGEGFFGIARIAPPLDLHVQQADHAFTGDFLAALPAIDVAFRIAEHPRSLWYSVSSLRQECRKVSLHMPAPLWEFF